MAGFGLDGSHAACVLTAFGLGELDVAGSILETYITACERGCLMDARVYELSWLEVAFKKRLRSERLLVEKRLIDTKSS